MLHKTWRSYDYCRGMLFVCGVLVGCGGEVSGGGSSGGSGGKGGVSTTSTSSSTSSGMGGTGGEATGGGGVGGNGTGGSNTGGSNTGGNGTGGSNTGGSGTGGSGTGGSGGDVPLPMCMSGNPVVMAMNRVLLGDTNPDGMPNTTNGWKQYGFDLDGRASTKLSTDLCKPIQGATPTTVYTDGNNGIDNSFGKNVVPLLLALTPDFAIANNQSIAAGKLTHLLSIENDGQGACTTSSRLYLGGNLGKPPLFDGSDKWPIDSTSLFNAADLASAKCTYLDTKIVLGFVKAGPPTQLNFVIEAGGYRMTLPIQHARVQFQLDANQQNGTSGQIGGIIATEELVTAMETILGTFDSGLCNPNSPTRQAILDQIRAASDILSDGSQDPNKDCNGVSIGLGFTAKAVQLGSIVPPPIPMDPCVP